MTTNQPSLREIHATLTAYLHGTLKPGQKLPTPPHLSAVRKMLRDCGIRPDPANLDQERLLRELLDLYLAAVSAAVKGRSPTPAMLAEARQCLAWAGVVHADAAPAAVTTSVPFPGGDSGSNH